MADSPSLPSSRAWKLVPSKHGGAPDLPLEFFQFFRELTTFVSQTQGNTAELAGIQARLDALESAASSELLGQHSVRTVIQDAQTLIRLVGDVANPGASTFYGTSEDGARGWYQRLLSTLADVDLTGLADGDALLWDATAERFVPGQQATPQMFTRITADGDVRITADGDIRITD